MGAKRPLAQGKQFAWDSFYHTPQVMMGDETTPLYSKPIWPRDVQVKKLPILKVLEDNYEVIREEVLQQYEMNYTGNAYPFLFTGGHWSQLNLYTGRKFTEACEKGMPKTCDIMKKWLPQRDVHHYPWPSNQNEQVVVLKMRPNSTVEWHCGPSNNILNVHMGLFVPKPTGCSKLFVE